MGKNRIDSGKPLSAEQLEEFCQSFSAPYKLVSRMSYWTTEVYGLGKYIRKYGYYPKWLPLCVYTDHGPREQKPSKADLESTAPVQMFHSPNSVKHWKKVSKKPCYCYFSPFVYYRRSHGISLDSKAKGTIAFPAHTTPLIDDISDIQNYIDDLQKIPEEFQPISVCLHMHDINKGLHKKFIAAGFPVYTAGHAYDHDYIERFYSIIKQFKYGTSNTFGSYVFYCIELGIPFSIIGSKQQYINKSDPNVPIGLYDPNKECALYREASDLFMGIYNEINQIQHEYVKFHLGLDGAISRKKMATVLYLALLRNIISMEWVARAIKWGLAAKRRIRS